MPFGAEHQRRRGSFEIMPKLNEPKLIGQIEYIAAIRRLNLCNIITLTAATEAKILTLHVPTEFTSVHFVNQCFGRKVRPNDPYNAFLSLMFFVDIEANRKLSKLMISFYY